ncbi:hypothetical protein HZB04_01825 [Candidatus Wolfebacteria bacterium]|nr:hypothetical protein [Candidatus Wolfebacteria bacterium]
MPNKEAQPTQQFVDIVDIKNDALVLKGGSLRRILMVSGINFDLKSEEEQNIILVSFQNFLNTLDFSMQFVIHSRKMNTDVYLDNLKKRENAEENELMKNQIIEYAEFIKSFVEQNAVMAKNFFAVIPYNPTVIPQVGGLFFGLFGKPASKKNEKKDEDFEHNLIQLNQRTEQIIDGLNQIGLRAVALNNEELMELFYNFYNPGIVEKKI